MSEIIKNAFDSIPPESKDRIEELCNKVEAEVTCRLLTVHVLRPCLWFAKGDRIPLTKFREYYTSAAIRSLEQYEYVRIQ